MKFSFTPQAIDSSAYSPAATRSTVPSSVARCWNSGLAGRREPVDVEAEGAQPLGDELEVPGLVAGLARERDLHVELGRRADPRRRQLADGDLVHERDLQ